MVCGGSVVHHLRSSRPERWGSAPAESLSMVKGLPERWRVPLRQSSLASVFFFAPSLGSGRRDAALGGISRAAGLDDPLLR